MRHKNYFYLYLNLRLMHLDFGQQSLWKGYEQLTKTGCEAVYSRDKTCARSC